MCADKYIIFGNGKRYKIVQQSKNFVNQVLLPPSKDKDNQLFQEFQGEVILQDEQSIPTKKKIKTTVKEQQKDVSN